MNFLLFLATIGEGEGGSNPTGHSLMLYIRPDPVKHIAIPILHKSILNVRTPETYYWSYF